MKSVLEKRILLFAFVLLTVTITVNTGLNIEGFRRDYRDGIALRCQSQATGLKMMVEKVLALGLTLVELDGINARCQEIVATDPEIAYCLIEDAHGKPLYSNDPSFLLTSDIRVISSSGPETTLIDMARLGAVYDISLPLIDSEGTVAGRVRVGFPVSVLEERTTKTMQRSLFILVGAFLVVFGIVFIFTRTHLIGPIRRLRDVASEIAGGNLSVEVPQMPTADFAELGTALEEMASSLSSRDHELRRGYQELEETNSQLQESYEFQERIGAELGRSREMYRALLENASDPIIVSDRNDRLVIINKAAERLFGIDRDKQLGLNVLQMWESIGCVDMERIFALYGDISERGSCEMELHYTRPSDGRTVVGWVRSSAVADRHGERMVQAIIRDVTREREIKENLETSTRELERLNQMKDSFLGVASHELKTPLTVIIGYSELLLNEMGDDLDPAAHAMVRYIADAAERLSGIVRDIVDVSLLDGKRMRPRLQESDINKLVDLASGEMSYFFHRRKQQLVKEFAEGLPSVQCDPVRLSQAINNLIGNAVKFTPDGGTVTLSTRLVKNLRVPLVTQDESADTLAYIDGTAHPYIEIAVRDNGIGISIEDQIHIFDEFYEVGNVEEHFTGKMAFKGKGTGLGLSIARGIVHLHGGEIWVESSGHDTVACPGSIFHLLLPVYPASPLPAGDERG